MSWGESYPLRDDAGQSPTGPTRYATVTCPVCRTQMYGTLDQVGQELICPDCGTPTVLPAPLPPSKPAGARNTADEYAIRDVAAAAPSGSGAAPNEFIRVFCPLCNTLMYGEAEQVGQKIVCPDCRTTTIVPPPSKSPAKKPPRSAIEVGEYGLAGAPSVDDHDASTEAHEKQAEQEDAIDVGAVCPRCQTRLDATGAPVGSTLECPDCGSPVIVPRPRPTGRKRVLSPESSEGYGLDAGAEIVMPDVAAPWTLAASTTAEPSEPAPIERQIVLPGERRRLPRRPLLTSTFTFPFSRTVLAHTIGLAVVGICPVGFVAAIQTIRESSSGTSLVLAAISSAVLLIFAVMWAVWAAACALSVLRDTANGCDEIYDWPDLSFFDWLGEPFYVINSMCMGAAPGAIVWRLLESVDRQGETAPAVSLFLLFPFLLLSMIEKDTAFTIFSATTFQSLWTAWAGWARFYLATGVMLAVAGLIGVLAFSSSMSLGIIVTLALFGVVWFAYFRLLGRLVWYCMEQASHAEPETETDDDSF